MNKDVVGNGITYTKREKYTTLAAALLGWAFDGFDLMIVSFLIPEIIAELDVTIVDFSAFVLLPMLGITAVGGIVFGVIADKIGRKTTLNFSILLYSTATGAVFFCPTGSAGIAYIAICRVIAGLGIGGEWAVGFALINEVWGPTKHRGRLGGITHGFFGVGVVLASVLATVAAPYGWRTVFGIAAFPALLVFFIRFFVPESKLWLKYKELEKKGALPEWLRATTKRAPVAQIFEGEFAKITKRATVLATGGLFIYYIVFSWLPTFLKNPFREGGLNFDDTAVTWTIVSMSVVGIPACMFGGWLSDLLGRRRGFFVWTLFGVAGMSLFWYATTFALSATHLVISSLLIYAAGLGYFGVYGVWFTELYPTRIRTTGSAFCFNIGRGIAATAPVIVAIMALQFKLAGGMSIAVIAFIGMALLIWFIPETKGKDLKVIDIAYEKYMESRRKAIAARAPFPTSGISLIAIGSVFMIITLPWSSMYAPTLRIAPTYLEKSTEYVGTLVVYNFDDCVYDTHNIIATEYLNSTSSDEQCLWLTYQQYLKDKDTGEHLVKYEADPDEFIINRRTLACSDARHQGQFAFPIGVEKKSYAIWNRDINRTSTARFVGETVMDGVKCYKYQIVEQDVDIEVPRELEENISGCTRRYSTVISIFVEPSSGSVVYVEKYRVDNVSIPDLRKLPDDLNVSREFYGTLTALNETTVLYDTDRIVVNVTIRAVRKINDTLLLLNETTKVYKLLDGTRILMDDYSSYADYVVDRKTAMYKYLPDYSAEKRSGQFTFPVGVRYPDGTPIKSFSFWHNDLKKEVNVTYAGEVAHPITKDRLFLYQMVLVNESQPLQEFLETEEDPVPGALATYNGTFHYYVHPNLGVIVDMTRTYQWRLLAPPLNEIYYRLNASLTYVGTYEIFNETEKKWHTYNVTVYHNVTPKLNRTLYEIGLHGNKGLAEYYENLTVVDNATSKIIDEIHSEPVVAIQNLTWYRYLRDRPDIGFKGRWRFPPFSIYPVEKTYTMMNADIKAPIDVNAQFNVSIPYEQLPDTLIFKIYKHNYTYEPEDNPTRDIEEKYYTVTYISVNKTSGTVLNVVKDAKLGILENNQFKVLKKIHTEFSDDTKKKARLAAFAFTASLAQMKHGAAAHALLADVNVNYSLYDVLTVSADAADKSKKVDALSLNTIQLVTVNVTYSDEQKETAVHDAKDLKSRLRFADEYVPHLFLFVGGVFIAVGSASVALCVKKKRR